MKTIGSQQLPPRHPTVSDNSIILCPSCGISVSKPPLNTKQYACCPRCNSSLYKGNHLSAEKIFALSLTGIILFIIANCYPLLSMDMYGIIGSATIYQGVYLLFEQGFYFVSILVGICAIAAPAGLLLCTAIISFSFLHQLNGRWLTWVLKALAWCMHWSMLEVYLVSFLISVFKLTSMAELTFGPGLVAFILLVIVDSTLFSCIDLHRYWESTKINDKNYSSSTTPLRCFSCGKTQRAAEYTPCCRCHHLLYKRQPYSIQKSWAYLISAMILLFPANWLPISLLTKNGIEISDTIFSGIINLVKQDMLPIAIIVFIASIVVPIAKIVCLSWILISIQFKQVHSPKSQMVMFKMVDWIGRWSILDLFVIAIMMTLIDKGTLLSFIPGPAATSFGLVVVLTLFAARSFDPRLIWDSCTIKNNEKNAYE